MPPPVSFITIGLFVATIGFSIGLDADIFGDVAGAEVFRGGALAGAPLRKLGPPEPVRAISRRALICSAASRATVSPPAAVWRALGESAGAIPLSW